MKKILVTCVVLVLLTGAFRFVLGFFPWHLTSALDVATGLGAKIACSGYYLSHQTEQQIVDDLASYSPATRLVNLDFSQPNRVVANLKGLSVASATYRTNLGCTLDVGNTQSLDNLVVEDIVPIDAPWPMGLQVTTLNQTVQQLATDIVEQDNQEGLQTRALIVVKNGVIVAEAYGPNITPTTPLLGWSMGKSLTAIMLGRYDYLNQTDSLANTELFDVWKDERSKITLESMLQMSSGLSFDETYAPGSDSTHMLFSAHSASSVALDSGIAYAPGKHFSYSSGTTNMLTRWLFEKLGGTPQANVDFLNSEIFTPLGMHTATFEMDPSGVFVGSSYIYASGRDWARLGWLMVNQGQINGQQILSAQWVKKASAANVSQNYPEYGYQFWLNSDITKPNANQRWENLPADAFFMMGNRKQAVMMVPSQKAVVVRLGWTTGSYPMEERFSELLGRTAQL